jgi:hypothetical protein
MNDNFTNRLLDASLKGYSRVSPSEDFASRVLAKGVARRPAWRWLWIPAVAAAALACGVLIMRPAPVARTPLVAFHPKASPIVRTVQPPPLAVKHIVVKNEPAKPPFHTLTGVELASMTLPRELFAKQEEKPITEIVIPELTVAPLEIPTIPEAEGEKQP